MQEQVFTNCLLLLPDRELLGTLIVRDGQIADIQPGISQAGQDLDGAYLMPGLVELHTDNLERCTAPRPGVAWPLDAAISWHDRDMTTAGITSVCTAIAVRDIPFQGSCANHVREIVGALDDARSSGRLAADHRLHLRCELHCDDTASILETHLDHPRLAVVSLMDHSPGQRQFVRLDKFHEYYRRRYNLSEPEIEAYRGIIAAAKETVLPQNRYRIAEMARRRGIALASHDDADVEHVRESAEAGTSIAEFPTTLVAAREAKRIGQKVLMSAPNTVLGGSHSGNVSTWEVAQSGCLDILSSDYAPPSLLHAVFLLAEAVDLPMYRAVKLAAENPAGAIAGFQDRGSLEIGKRADFLVVRSGTAMPRIDSVHVSGKRVA